MALLICTSKSTRSAMCLERCKFESTGAARGGRGSGLLHFWRVSEVQTPVDVWEVRLRPLHECNGHTIFFRFLGYLALQRIFESIYSLGKGQARGNTKTQRRLSAWARVRPTSRPDIRLR